MSFIHPTKQLLRWFTLLLFVLSGNTVAAAEPSVSWVKISGTYTEFTNRDGTTTPGDFWYADDNSIINIRDTLNLTIADSEGLTWHLLTSCNPRHSKYRQMNFSVAGTDHRGEWSPVGTDARRNSAFKFICSRYGKVKHGKSFQSN